MATIVNWEGFLGLINPFIYRIAYTLSICILQARDCLYFCANFDDVPIQAVSFWFCSKIYYVVLAQRYRIRVLLGWIEESIKKGLRDIRKVG